MKAWGANRKAQLCGADQSSIPRGLRWQSPSQHPREGSGTKAHDRNQEVGVCPCALQAQKKGTGPSVSLYSIGRSQSQHFAIRSFLREALRAKPLMSWRRLYLIKSAKPMCYIRSKAFILSFQNSARERPMDREKVAEVLLDLMEEGRMKNNTFHLLLL